MSFETAPDPPTHGHPESRTATAPRAGPVADPDTGVAAAGGRRPGESGPGAAGKAVLPRVRTHPATWPLAALVAGAAGAVYLYGTNPHEQGHFLPRCPFNWATGLLCPACGGTRMAYDLMHGDPVRALHDNAALLVLGVPLAAYLGGRWLWEGLRGRRYLPRLGRLGTAAVLGTAVTWTVVRNVLG